VPSPAFATAINDAGDIVGKTGSGANGRAFLWQGGRVKMLGTLPTVLDPPSSVAFAVNNRGAIVGSSGDNGVGPMDGFSFVEAFIYDASMMKQLVAHPVNQIVEEQRAFGINNGTVATAINGSGQIVGATTYNRTIAAPADSCVSLARSTVRENL
jgi:probable HAF family extracellular repeat protein